MEKYSLHLSDNLRGMTTEEVVISAFRAGGTLRFEGVRERVPVRLETAVKMIKLVKPENLMTFSGVVLEDERPYVARFFCEQPEPTNIDIEVRDMHESIPTD